MELHVNRTTSLVERHTSKKSENVNVEEDLKVKDDADDQKVQAVRDKWKAHRKKMMSGKAKHSPMLNFFVWYTIYMAVTFLYVGHRFWADMYFAQYGEWAPYYFKVFITFITIQVIANWLCTQLYDTTHKHTQDRPDAVRKSIWDEVQESNIRTPPSKPTVSNLTDEAHEKLKKEIDNLSWKFCHVCNLAKPPRAHHCKVCNKCILKRGHHCFITGVCIGHYNERYFVVYTFYTALTMMVLGPLTYYYLRDTFYDNSTILDYILPITIYKWLAGYYGHQYIFCVVFLYSVWWILPMTASLFFHQMAFIYTGLTGHEFHNNLSIKNTDNLSNRLKSVFGPFWFLNFYFPAVLLFRQEGDGKTWNNLKIVYKYIRGGKAPQQKQNMD